MLLKLKKKDKNEKRNFLLESRQRKTNINFLLVCIDMYNFQKMFEVL